MTGCKHNNFIDFAEFGEKFVDIRPNIDTSLDDFPPLKLDV